MVKNTQLMLCMPSWTFKFPISSQEIHLKERSPARSREENNALAQANRLGQKAIMDKRLKDISCSMSVLYYCTVQKTGILDYKK